MDIDPAETLILGKHRHKLYLKLPKPATIQHNGNWQGELMTGFPLPNAYVF